jgi:hypothetical protein
MTALDIRSLFIGIGVTVVTTVVGYFLTQILLFRTKIFFPMSFDQVNESSTYKKDDRTTISFGLFSTCIQVTGHKAARNVKIYFENNINTETDKFEIDPSTPYNIERNTVSINVLKIGLYKLTVKTFKNEHKYISMRIKEIESENAESIQRGLMKQRFHFNSNLIWMIPLGIAVIQISLELWGKLIK